MTDENGDLMDGIVGHSLDPDGDPELMLFGQLIFGTEGQHVTFPWQAHSFTDNLIGPGQRKWRDFEIPASSLTGNEIRVLATLKYRTFPPFMLRELVGGGYLTQPKSIRYLLSIWRRWNRPLEFDDHIALTLYFFFRLPHLKATPPQLRQVWCLRVESHYPCRSVRPTPRLCRL